MILTETTAGDLMRTNIETANADETLRAVARRMSTKRIYCMLVPPRDGRGAAGILTSKDIVQLLGHQPPAVLDEMRVADVMTKPVIGVQQDMSLVDCINLMRMTGVRRVPVMNASRVVGILSYTDIFELVVRDNCAQPVSARS